MYQISCTRRIYIELNNECNLNCRFCPHKYLKDKKQELSIECVKHILDDINKNVEYRIVYFHNVSEPLLYPHIDEIISYCDKNGIRFGLTTNGLLLNDHIIELSKSNIHTLNISYQITNQYEHEMRGMKISLDEYRESILYSICRLVENGFKGKIKIKLLVTDKKSYFNGTLITGINSIDELTTEVDKIYSLFNKRHLDAEKERLLRKITINQHCKIEIAPNIYIETFPFLSWGNYFEPTYKACWGRCDGISGQLLIRSNGDVCPCCYDLNSDICLGNIYNQPLSDILLDKNTLSIQKKINSKVLYYERCSKCFGKTTLKDLVKEQIIELKRNDVAEQFRMSNNIVKL